MVKGKSLYKLLQATVMLVAITGCSVEKNTSTTRFYHSLTSKYNIFFNGNESFKSGIEKVTKAYKDDYSELLRIFEYSDPAMVQVSSADMDRAIQKASKVISLKSITARPETNKSAIPNEKDEEFLNRKEYNEWVEKSYLLMGKARIYKHEFELAKSTLSYNLSYSYNNAVKNESSIWLARVYTETGNYNEARRILRELDISKGFSKYLFSLYYTSLTDLDIRQKRYDEAASNLEKAIKYISGKRNKYRLTYLLAQLYEKTNDNNRVSSIYRKVIKMNPPYEVEFAARINLAGAFNPEEGNTASIKKELGKMIRNPKNKEYLDQIYFVLANLCRKEGKNDEAIDFYKKSVAAGTSNSNQKGKAFLALAEYYFSVPDYLTAGKYYDSATLFLDQKYSDFQSVKLKAANLSSLITQLLVIQREDSLQKVARMSDSERNILIASIIDDVRRSENETMVSGQSGSDNYNLGQYYENERRFRTNIEQEGKWYFYNQAALTFGRTEFRRRWGERKLEDNWRRFNKARVSATELTEGQTDDEKSRTPEIPVEADNKKPEYYLRYLPLNDSLISLSNQKIASALLEAGKIYYESFSDSRKAVETLENLLQRFPGNKLEPEALYTLNSIYKRENSPMEEIYRQRLLEKYPGNEFTKIIIDTSYFSRKPEEEKQVELLYQQAYNAWVKEDFYTAAGLCNNGLAKFPRHELTPKFQLLKSYCIARTEGERAFKEELNKVINSWPGSEEAIKAEELIAFLNQEIPELKIEEDKQIAKEIYTDDKDTPHIFALVIMDPSFNINQATFDVISYNIDNYTNRNFRTAGALIGNKYIMITVSGFRDVKDALDYYRAFRTDREVRNPSGIKMITFVIGSKNIEALEKDMNPERYRIYFEENYPVNGN
ncbi:MAG: type IX secretion system periplasmic lipoprotein PorW/SprE [Bacteroidales bacterium]